MTKFVKLISFLRVDMGWGAVEAMKRVLMGFALVGFAILISTGLANAVECDFQKRIGSCKGAVEILSSGGSKPSYSAEVRVSSSAPTCSRVEYFLDNTPNTTVLKSSRAEQESLFGTKPITKQSISIKGCSQYAEIGQATQKPAPAEMDLGECIRRHKAALAAKTTKLGLDGYAQAHCGL